MKPWTWTPAEKKTVYCGTLVESSLHTQAPKEELIAGHSYSIEDLIAGNGIIRKKFNLFSSLMP